MFETYFRNAVFLLMLASDAGDRSLLNFEHVFTDDAFRRRLCAACPDPGVRNFWRKVAERSNGDASLENIAPYIIAKMSQITASPLTRRFLEPGREAIDFRRLMNEGQVVVLRLPKGTLGEYDCRFLGALTLSVLSEAVLSRAAEPVADRRPFRVYCDEFQNLATESAATMLAECRKFGVSLVLANQSLSQLSGSRFRAGIAQDVLANCGTIASFRLGVSDAEIIAAATGALPKAFLSLSTGEFLLRAIRQGAPQPVQRVFGAPPEAS